MSPSDTKGSRLTRELAFRVASIRAIRSDHRSSKPGKPRTFSGRFVKRRASESHRYRGGRVDAILERSLRLTSPAR